MNLASRAPASLLILFMDFPGYTAEAQRRDDMEIAETIDAAYKQIAVAIESTGGTLVKFMGDATLAVYPEDAVDAGIRMALALTPTMDRFMVDHGWECRLTVRAHVGPVIAGPFGATGRERFDVIGRAVNTTARLPLGGVTLSVEAFQRCAPEVRQRFTQNTPSVSYRRVGDA